MSREERLELFREIWQSLESDGPEDVLSDEQKQELDRRLSAHEANPQTAIGWEEAEALARIRK